MKYNPALNHSENGQPSGRRVQIVALLLFSVAFFLTGCGGNANQGGADSGSESSSTEGQSGKKIKIAMLPKLVNIDYFDACQKGAQKAADELGVELIYDGPTTASGVEQNKFIETWVRQGVDAICVAPNQPKAIKRFVKQAQGRGIKVLTWDSDAAESGRSFMINQVNDAVLGRMLMDDLARQMGEEGEWAIAIASLDATNLNTWRKYAEEQAKAKYPKLKLVETVVTNEDEEIARQKIETVMNAHPNLKGIVAFDSNSVPGSAEAIKRAGKAGEVMLVGNSTPKTMRPYIKEGILESFYLWNPQDLGGLTVRVAKELIDGNEIKAGSEIPGFGPLRFHPEDPTVIILSDPIRFTSENIDSFDFGI